jgi:hypothetical protein
MDLGKGEDSTKADKLPSPMPTEDILEEVKSPSPTINEEILRASKEDYPMAASPSPIP